MAGLDKGSGTFQAASGRQGQKALLGCVANGYAEEKTCGSELDRDREVSADISPECAAVIASKLPQRTC
ncbi:hypothetical protein BIV09_07085 [Pseudomonas sp. 7SR1]|nr:hypothetical protein BIV09_07085 [Pseudomonas sp. 7SR1]